MTEYNYESDRATCAEKMSEVARIMGLNAGNSYVVSKCQNIINLYLEINRNIELLEATNDPYVLSTKFDSQFNRINVSLNKVYRVIGYQEPVDRA